MVLKIHSIFLVYQKVHKEWAPLNLALYPESIRIPFSCIAISPCIPEHFQCDTMTFIYVKWKTTLTYYLYGCIDSTKQHLACTSLLNVVRFGL